MRRSIIVRLRRVGIWDVGRRARRLIAPPICAGIHAAVQTLGPRFLPDDLVLKHYYDYHPVWIDPKDINGMLRAAAGTKPSREAANDRLARYRAWRDLGGGWKNANLHITRSLHGRFVAGGDWDMLVEPFEALESMVDIFVEGREPAHTAEYQKLLSKIESGDFMWTRGMTSVAQVNEYFAQLKRIFEDIRSGGYRTQAQLGGDGSDEVRVCIDRDGRLFVFGGGTHRLSIALLLEVERVPVLVKRVHARWADQCKQRYGGTVRAAIARGIQELDTGSRAS